MCVSSSFSERGSTMPLKSPRVVLTAVSLQTRMLNFFSSSSAGPL